MPATQVDPTENVNLSLNLSSAALLRSELVQFTDNRLALLMIAYLDKLLLAGTGGSGTVAVTPHPRTLSSGATGTIPVGAKGFVLMVYSGTITLTAGSDTGVFQVGSSPSSSATLGTAINYTVSSGGSGVLYYEN